MDDTQHSKTSDAAATRKRRSSILKLQRAPRAPFSELEFNVATPTDTAKSRRVSFSRRTGVAEFVTNEATTTWQKFYEEHNKSLESSGNDSAANPPRSSVGHIGKRIFDEQFQEIEAVDFVSTLDDGRGRNIDTSLNTANFAEQLASLENTGDDKKLTAPQRNFELSAFTDHKSKVFGDDLAISCMGELSDRFSVNFSAVQPIGEFKDDLDEIQRDFQTAPSYGPTGVGSGPFRDGKDMSEYIEVALNMTNAAIRNESDMSITDTMHSPKVENISRNISIEKKSSVNKSWVADKENIQVNPYVAPKESANFAINEEEDKVLVFDGKRLTIQSEKDKAALGADYRKTLLPNTAPDPTHHRKTIVMNVNDDLPNFVDDPYVFMSQGVCKGMDVSNNYSKHDGDLSMTQSLSSKDVNERRRTIIYGNDTGNISITQALPGNIVKPENEKRRTIVYESNSANISVTQAVSSNIILSEIELLARKSNSFRKEKTIVYEDNACNISITQAVPSNIITSSQHNIIPDSTRTVLFNTESGDISVTQTISSNISPKKSVVLSEKRKTIIFEDVAGNLSITQAIPSNILVPESEEVMLRGKTVIYDDSEEISVTQDVPTNLIMPEKESIPDRRKTMVYDDDSGNISITQAVPANILLNGAPLISERRDTVVFETDSGDISVTEMIPSNLILSEKRKTIGSADMSVTQAVPSHLILPKKNTVVHDGGSSDMSVTQEVHSNLILSENRTIVHEIGSVDMPVTHVVPSNTLFSEKRQNIIHDSIPADMSVTQALPSSLISNDNRKSAVHGTGFTDNMFVAYGNTTGSESFSIMSDTQALPLNNSNLIIPEKLKTIVYDSDSADISMTEAASLNLTPDKVDTSESRKAIVHDDSAGNISVSHTAYAYVNDKVDDKMRDNGNISVTQAMPFNIISPEMKQYDVFETETRDISNSQILPKNVKSDIQTKELITYNDTLSNTSHKILIQGADISMTESELLQDKENGDILKSEDIPFKNTKEPVKINTIVFDNGAGNMSIAKPISLGLISIEKDILGESKLNSLSNLKQDELLTELDITNLQQSVLVYQAETDSSCKPKSKTNDSINVTPIHSSIEPIVPPSEIQQHLMKSIGNMNPTSSSSDRPTASDKLVINEDSKGSVLENNIMKPSSATSGRTVDSDFISADSKPRRSVLGNIKSISATTDSHLNAGDENSTKPVLDEGNLMKPASLTSVKTLDSVMCRVEDKSKKSLLDDLLDMSNASMADGIDDKNIMVKLSSEYSQKNSVKFSTGDTSSDSLFIITKDSEDEGQRSNTKQSDKLLITKSSPPLEYIGKDNSGIVTDLQNKLLKIKAQVAKPSTNRHFETVVSSKTEKNVIKDEPPKAYISFKEADSTKDLLEILSNFTDKEEETNPIEDVKISSELSVADRAEIPERRRLSFAPRRQSIVISREDLLNNISMAQAVLQKSRVDIDDTDTIEDTNDTMIEERNTQPMKTARISNEVVKKLQFEEDSSYSDMSNKSETASPLRKTVFGEESYMKENNPKANVIPTYLKDVSENIKLLMNDLVKPMTGVMPFESIALDNRPEPVASTCSMQVQADLLTSSQIDIDTEPSSIIVTTKDDAYSLPGILDVTKKTLQSALKSVTTRFSSDSSQSNVEVKSNQSFHLPAQTVPGATLVFDQSNPLNNVHFRSLDYSKVHRYNPSKSNETLVASDNSENISTKVTFKEVEMEYDVGHVTTEYGATNRPISTTPMTGAASSDKLFIVGSVLSNISKHESTDRSIATTVEVKDTEVNTWIAMKGNKDLLDASSSLTLVDDALAHEQFDVDLDLQSKTESVVKQKSPVRVIYKIDEDASCRNKDSDVTSNDEEYQEASDNLAKAKKRSYSPTILQKHNNCTLSSIDTTPKPTKKMQKLSDCTKSIAKNQILPTSPDKQRSKCRSEKYLSPEREMNIDAKQSPKSQKKSQRQLKTNKPGTTITVQQLITDYHLEASIGNNKPMDSSILEALKNEADLALRKVTLQSQSDAGRGSSCSSRIIVEEGRSVTTTEFISSSRVKEVTMDCQPELLNELSSKNLVTECESSVNVVSKIDILPFMGTRDCEWESRGSDAWSFRLLHGRLRLAVRLAHRHDNASRSRVRADTPLVSTTLETPHQDESDQVVALCVHFAGESMRRLVGRGCARAGEVPALLRRCAGVSRVALQWGRVMNDARLRLAFSLSDKGHLALKVANIPLRSVWEVTMQLDMVQDDSRDLPWPGAVDVRVAPVVSDVRVTAEEVRRAFAQVPHDWGHAPKTIWKIFRYLKNKRMDDDQLLGL